MRLAGLPKKRMWRENDFLRIVEVHQRMILPNIVIDARSSVLKQFASQNSTQIQKVLQEIF